MSIVKPAFFLLLIAVLGLTCTSNTSHQEGATTDAVSDAVLSNQKEISNETVKNVIRKIPSPLEATNILKGSGVYFYKEMLNNTSNAKNYSTNFQKALNLGIYGADLGYINIYEKIHLSMGYVAVVKSLADELNIGQFFDFVTLERLTNNTKNIDSLLYISTSGFENMHNYLNERDRSNISILVLTGGWLESLYISTNIITSVDSVDHFFEKYPELVERIGEQKMVLDDVIILLNAYKNSSGFDGLITEFNELREIYREVLITYIYKQPDIKEINGALVIQDNSEIIVNITSDQLEAILSKVKSIRNNIVL